MSLKPNGRKRPALSSLKAFHMTTINPTIILTTRKGAPIRLPGPVDKDGNESPGEALTLFDAVQMAVDSRLDGDDKMGADAKLKLDRIARKFAAGEAFEISAKEATVILERANGFWGALVYGELVAHLDPAQLDA
jgi:hypothetical protein